MPGGAVKAHTVYPLFVNNQLVLPAGSELIGKITQVTPASRPVRNAARMHGDFTPLRVAHVDFGTLVLPNGRDIPLHTLTATDGVEVIRFQAANASTRRSLTKKVWEQLMERKHETINSFTAPGKWDRAKQAAYMQLPLHPQVLRSGTQYEVKLSEPLQVPLLNVAQPNPATTSGINKAAVLNAELLTDLDSKTTPVGTVAQARVTEPLRDIQGHVQVPQGTILTGKVTQARPAAKWGKGGTLRFTFQQMRFPEGFQQTVGGTMRAVDSARQQNLRVDVEGGVAPQRAGAALPFVMGLLTAGALHEDENASATTVGASNGFALIGRIVALASGTRYASVALGAFATSRSVYERFIGRGKDITFPKETRIEIAVDPVNSPILTSTP